MPLVVWEPLKIIAGCCWDAALEFTFGDRCPLCRQTRHLPGEARQRLGFCRSCLHDLLPPAGDHCKICSAPVGPYVETDQGCIHCRNDRSVYQRAVSLGVYQHQLRHACLQAKQPGQTALAASLAELLWQVRQAELREFSVDGIVTVPDHWTDRFSRDRHPTTVQAELLAHRLKVPFFRHILRKSKRTRRQSSLSPTNRRRNVKGVFLARRTTALKNARVLLVDDVLTTGSTANEVAKVLKQAGAQQVFVAAIARGLGQSTPSI